MPNLQLNASTNESTTTALIYSPMNSPPSCKRPMIFFKYVLSLIIPAFKPTSNDLKQYAKVLDANGDGAVTLQDL